MTRLASHLGDSGNVKITISPSIAGSVATQKIQRQDSG